MRCGVGEMPAAAEVREGEYACLSCWGKADRWLEEARAWLDENAFMVQPFDKGEDESNANRRLAAALRSAYERGLAESAEVTDRMASNALTSADCAKEGEDEEYRYLSRLMREASNRIRRLKQSGAK